MQPDRIGHRMEIAAFFVAFLGLFAVATIPIVNLVVAPFVPIPLAAIFLRNGFGAGFFCLAAAVVLLFASGSAPAQLYSLPYLCSALVLGMLGRRVTGA